MSEIAFWSGPRLLRFTDIREGCPSGFLKVDVAIIQKISGQETTKMVMHYAHLFDGHVDAVMSALDTGFVTTITPELHTAPAE